MTTKDKLLSTINDRQQDLDSQREMVEALSEPLSQLDLDAMLYGSTQLDFDGLSHAEVVKVIRAFGGKWSKTPSDNATVDYLATVDGFTIRCWQGKPPPNCKIVEEDVLIPAQPERMGKIRKLVCKESKATNGA